MQAMGSRWRAAVGGASRIKNMPKWVPKDQLMQVGAMVVEQLHDVDVVMGIKEPSVASVQALGGTKTWMMFSHTHKGQVRLVGDWLN
jgi:hypothetical protein